MKKLPNIDLNMSNAPLPNPNMLPSSEWPMCSQKDVFFQNPPTINVVSYSSSGRSLSLSYTYDLYSKAGVSNSVPKIKVRYRNDIYGNSGILKEVSTTGYGGVVSMALPELPAGIYYLKADINDGIYSKTVDVGVFRVVGVPVRPCPSCNPL